MDSRILNPELESHLQLASGKQIDLPPPKGGSEMPLIVARQPERHRIHSFLSSLFGIQVRNNTVTDVPNANSAHNPNNDTAQPPVPCEVPFSPTPGDGAEIFLKFDPYSDVEIERTENDWKHPTEAQPREIIVEMKNATIDDFGVWLYDGSFGLDFKDFHDERKIARTQPNTERGKLASTRLAHVQEIVNEGVDRELAQIREFYLQSSAARDDQ